MSSKREQILSRLFDIMSAIPEARTTVRNRGLLQNDVRPGLALLDGDEIARTTGDKRGRNRMSPQIMEMRPQIFVVMDARQPQNDGIGTDLNALKFAIEQGIAYDVDLLNLIGSNGDVTLIRAESDLKSGSAMLGQLRLDFIITYVLDPYQV